jgi:hypothetical protein
MCRFDDGLITPFRPPPDFTFGSVGQRAAWPSLAEQVAISLSAQPSGPRKMALAGTSGALGVLIRIDVQHDAGHLAPVGPFLGGVQQVHVGDGVLPIICRQLRLGRGYVYNG